ncbi:MAG: BREX-1 system adenine-specific DNA-methyltransferase PglX [Dechloromonas sp.]|uniref:site-specific DNA-methyltransferase (adenine-specific) n=1 Tax=Candidatus Dechloromonas phosphorivorans TaxID=2899244 RepID=A0A935K0K8_9RHOO|nr:BREX-1 system adenine-specific DNA-methyltransferase PglX [Candidatus Dechloromonas phosphorivorans]
MAFDQSTRNRLQRFVNDARKVQEEEFTRQLQNDYGLDPTSGTITPLENLRHLNDAQRETARILRDTLAHYCASQEADAQTGLERIVREQAFTVLNRLAALRMAEARGLLIESVGNGYQAKGFQLYARLAGTGLGETGDAYRVYLFSVFDELAQDLPGLFDRYSPQGRLFPREASLLQLLALINDAEIEPLWAEDETIGWIYQYFNSKEERKAMRDASQAPRNSRELAVRNQFFTPRYVVEFLVDNTLGRLWFNATGGKSALAGRCQYLLVKPDEQPVASSRLRDPRTLKLLDPACGSMHFGLYAFDLFLEIYREAWDWEQEHGPGSLDISTQPSAHFKPLNQTYADQASFLRDVPRLIIEHNIYGVDIDPRAAQIASLALWLRAQRAWHAEDVKAKDRPLIGRGHVVAAIAPPAERELRLQFTAELDQLDAVLFEKTLQLLKGLPEMGVLLQVEREIPNLIRQIYVGGKGNDLLSKQEQETWQKAEARLRDALIGFTQAAKATYQGRLFAQDALEGLRLIDLTREKFDVVVMNPPFGLPSAASKGYLVDAYPDTWKDIYAAFIERSLDLLRNAGFLGAITPSMWQYTREMRALRKMLFDVGSPTLLVELGGGVMDDAAVEAAVWTATKSNSVDELWSMDLLYERKEERATLMLSKGELWRQNKVEEFSRVADSPYCHHLPRNLLNLWKHPGRLSQVARIAAGNTTFDDFRFLRFWVETASEDQEKWRTYRSGGDFQPFYAATKLRILWERDGASVRASGIAKHGSDAQVMQSSELWNQGGLGYPRIGTLGLGIRVAPTGEIFSSGSVFILPEDSDQRLVLLGLLNSSLALALFEAHGRHRKTETIALKDLPVLPGHLQSIQNSIESDVLKAVDAIQSLESMDETNLLFVRPWPSSRFGSLSEYSETVYKRVLSSATSISNAIATHLGVDATNLPAPDAINWNPRVAIEEEAARVFSYLVGVTFGRWDIRKGISGDGTRPSTDPFASLPASPLGGMQKSSAYLSSKVQSAEKIQVTYPIEVVKKGVIDDDASAISSLVAKIAESMCVVWGQGAEEIEQAICAALGVTDFGQYLRKPSCFFSDHIRRYSSNRRQAPIYWPLTTTSGNYTLWLYYPSLSSQTLYTAVNDFVEPKLKHVGDDVAALRNRGAARSRDDEKQFETLQAFELELIELRDKLLKIAQDYQPNHDDGVQITAAPLWPLFRHKPWQKILKDTWAKLEKGDYDWAHLAMNYWPARVREKCKTDKSLAIAHDLEALYVEPEAKPKKTRAAKGAGK